MKIKRIILNLFKPNKCTYLGYLIALIIIAIVTILCVPSLLVGLIVISLLFLCFELGFRYSYKIFHKKGLPVKLPLRAQDIPIEEHPYLPWVYKKNYNPPKNRIIYSEERQDFMLGGISTNNLRHVNGEDGGRDVLIPKPKDMYRILCLGDSTTCNYVRSTEGKLTSWPLKLERKLKTLNPKIEVNNCGQGGYNINEILVKFMLDTIDTEPDMVIFYHAFSNIRGYLTDNFERDFYHVRKTMSSSYPLKLTIARYVPTFGLKIIQFLVGEFFSYLNLKEDHVRLINRNNSINKDKSPEGLDVFERNIENLIHICKGKNIQLILSTYCYHLYDRVKDSSIHIKFRDTVQKENEIICKLAAFYGIPLVDNQKLVPSNNQNFIDEVHPTERGMELFTENFFTTIKYLLQGK